MVPCAGKRARIDVYVMLIAMCSKRFMECWAGCARVFYVSSCKVIPRAWFEQAAAPPAGGSADVDDDDNEALGLQADDDEQEPVSSASRGGFGPVFSRMREPVEFGESGGESDDIPEFLQIVRSEGQQASLLSEINNVMVHREREREGEKAMEIVCFFSFLSSFFIFFFADRLSDPSVSQSCALFRACQFLFHGLVGG